MARYFPRHFNIETSDYCNRSCAFCPIQHERDRSPPRLLDLALYERLLGEIGRAELPVKISLQWVDEPLANPSFFDYVDKGRALAPSATWLLQTNGDLLDEEKVAALSGRFDAICVNVYTQSAHRRLQKLELPFRPARFPGRLQSPGRLKPVVGDGSPPDGSPREALFHINEKFHDQDWVQWHDKASVPIDAPCTRVWEQASIGWDGTVYLCCRDNRREHPVGHLADGSLFDAFNSDKAKIVREHMEAGRRDLISMCHHCDKRFVAPFDALDDATVRRLTSTPDRDERRSAHQIEQQDARQDEPQVTPTLQQAIASRRERWPEAQHLPWGRWEYFSARAVARELGHLSLPGLLPRRYEVVVGLTAELASGIIDGCLEVAQDALLGIVVCGGRVMTRQRLALVDPSVFLVPIGPLRVGRKDRLRELGTDPRNASDLDVKVFVDEDQLDEATAESLALVLGERLEALGARLPISGHPRPLVRLLRVPSSCDAAAAFAHYNARREETLGKGPLSLEYSQLLWDRRSARDFVTEDATAPVRQLLLAADATSDLTSVPLVSLSGPSDDELPQLLELLDGPEASLYRTGRYRPTDDGGLSYHQLLCALIDFPHLEPSDVVVAGGLDADGRMGLRAGALSVRACKRAGRTHVRARVT